eukprot:gene24776-29722_t
MGLLSTALLGATAIAAAIVLVVSMPDIQRYLAVRVLIAGVGNIFLEDDGFGPEVVRALQHENLPSGARLVDYGIRGVHLAYDLLESWDALVLIDALPATGVPGKLAIIEVDPESEGPQGGFDAHSMHPSSLFASLQAL